jgi:putative nucleotidyltransferase with HDIG domain
LVNSAFFGLSHAVSSPSEAAIYLGIDTIKSLVLAIHTFSQFEDVKSCGFNLDALMHHSLSTAGRAGQVARLEDSTQKIVNECFVGGMLHDIGKLLMAANYPKDYERVTRLVAEGFSHCTAEREIFGVNHASVGSYLLRLWGLPFPVVEAIAFHHAPRQTTHPAFCALTAVHAANVFEHEDATNFLPAPENELDEPYLAALGLTQHVSEWRRECQNAETKEALTYA